MDADDVLARFGTLAMSPEQAERHRTHTLAKEEAYVLRYLIERECWDDDDDDDDQDGHQGPVNLFLQLAKALESCRRRTQAIDALQEGISRGFAGGHVVLGLAKAKLLFLQDRKPESLQECLNVINKGTKAIAAAHSKSDDAQKIADAYYLAGWVKIHADDHTAAYSLWSQGHRAVPSCPRLAKQHGKRLTWDRFQEDLSPQERCQIAGTVGCGGHADGVFNAEQDLESFAVRPDQVGCTPALALFDPTFQQSKVVFRTRKPVLTRQECQSVIEIVNRYHADRLGGTWGTVRSSSVKTTDVAVEDIVQLRPWLVDLLQSRLYPLINAAFPVLRDGSSVVDARTKRSRLRVHDAFIVRYDEQDESFSLPEHCDTSSMSLIVSLNSEQQGEYTGGGTWFQAIGQDWKGLVVNAGVGEAIAFAGPLRHAGFPIKSGCRIILVLFLYVQDFGFGHLVEEYGQQQQQQQQQQQSTCVNETNQRPSGDSPGGFVTYRQTVELANMLAE